MKKDWLNLLTCALIVWVLQPINWTEEVVRETFLTENECVRELNTETHQCLKIDKRKQLTYKEWKIDNCSLSEHKWTGLN